MQRNMKKHFGMIEVFYSSTGVADTRVCTFVKTHLTATLMDAFAVCKLHYKAGFKRKNDIIGISLVTKYTQPQKNCRPLI